MLTKQLNHNDIKTKINDQHKLEKVQEQYLNLQKEHLILQQNFINLQSQHLKLQDLYAGVKAYKNNDRKNNK